jgi:hypothetical protein
MKKFLISAAFVATIATPAFAQSYTPEYGTGNVNPPVYSSNDGSAASGSFAYAPRESSRDWRNSRAQAESSYARREDQNIPFEDHREDREY